MTSDMITPTILSSHVNDAISYSRLNTDKDVLPNNETFVHHNWIIVTDVILLKF